MRRVARVSGRKAAFWIALLTLLTWRAPARAAERSDLEKSLAAEALERLGWEPEEHPEGKIIEAIEVHAVDVFDDRDPVPDFVNFFHVTSQDFAVRRELLFHVGQSWSKQRVEETERNLRGLRQLSLANVVAARGSSPDHVRLVVVVKDVWSLRLNSSFGFGADGLEYLLINPAEENLAGTHMSAGLLYELEPFRHVLGARFVQPRLGGSRYWVATQAAVILNRDTGQPEGSSGIFIHEKPQFSLRSRFAHGTRVAWLEEISRRNIGTELRTFDYVHQDGSVERVPWQYQTTRLAAEYYGTNSFGVLEKLDLHYGVEVDGRTFRARGQEAFSAEARTAFEQRALPVTDTRISPFFQIRSYQGRFHRMLDMEILGLQEDYRLGHDVLLRTFVAAERLGSSRDLIGTQVGLGYTWALGSGLVRVAGETRNVLANEERNEGIASLALRVASPRLGPGRLHFDFDGAHRYFDYMNVAPFVLGGNGRLRGFRFNEFQGKDYVAGNVEFRTRSVDVLSAQVGLATFYDFGDAFDDTSEFDLKQSVGVGFRILFPQADRAVLRVDYGLPISPVDDIRLGAVYVTFGQAFGLPGIATPSVTSGVSPF